MTSWPQVTQATQINGAPIAAWPFDTNMDTGGGLDPGQQYGLLWQHRSWALTLTLAVIDRTTGPDMVLSSSKGLDVTMDPGSSAGRPLRWQCGPQAPIWLQVVDQIPGIDMAWLYQGPWTSTQILAEVGSITHNHPCVYVCVLLWQEHL